MATMTPHAGTGRLDERPPADQVTPGFRWTTEDRGGEEYVSDGNVWVRDEANVPWTLAYAEDLAVGAWVRRATKIGGVTQQIGPFLTGNPGADVTEFCQVLDQRRHDNIIAMILVRPDGEQVPYYAYPFELMQVRSEIPT